MYSFRNDYSEGAHPKVLQALADTNLRQTVGYGMDPCCQAAADTIRRLCAAPDAAVHFLVGGTQVNLVTIDAFLQSYEAVVAAQTGHVSTHETGAIEATGHKVCTVESPDGKLTPALVESVLAGHNGTEHMVLPRMVYISDTTEIGTVYTRAELAALRQCCDVHGLFLYLDGARLGSALTSPDNDLTLPELAALTHAFTIGGTKNGALFGEALVLTRPMPHFRWHMKQRGAVLAKGRLLGLQFQALWRTGSTSTWPAAPTSWPSGSGTASRPWDIPSRWPPPPISSSRYCPMRRWQSSRRWAMNLRPTTRWMRTTPASVW